MPLNRHLLRLRYGSSWGNQEKMVNCIFLYPPCGKVKRPHCDMGGGARGDCFIYLGKAKSCRFHKPLVKRPSGNELLARIVERRRQGNLVEIGLCPECITELKLRRDGDKVCPKCNLSWAYVGDY